MRKPRAARDASDAQLLQGVPLPLFDRPDVVPLCLAHSASSSPGSMLSPWSLSS